MTAKQDAYPQELLIEPRRGWISVDWAEILRYRELQYFLIWRDIKVRYKQTVLGITWAVLQPVFAMVVFVIIFGKLARIDSEGYPYAVFVYAGLLPWTFFATSVTMGGQSLVGQQHLLTKIYFPRLFVPSASVGASLVDLSISFVVYAAILTAYGIFPDRDVVFVPFLVILTVIAALGFTYTLAALTVAYRDFRYVIPFMVQAMMYLSPVVYPVSLVPEKFHWLLALNPMAGIIDGFRSAILGKPWNFVTLSVSSLSALLILLFGMYYFRKTEGRFADIA